LKYFRNTFEVFPKYPRGIPEIPSRYSRNTLEVFPKYPQGIPEIPLRYSRNTLKVFTNYKLRITKQRSAVANYETAFGGSQLRMNACNSHTTAGLPVETPNLGVFTTATRPSSPTHAGNPLGLSRSVEYTCSCHPASRSGCNPNGMQRPVWGCLSTERRIPAGCRPTSANDTCCVNPVTHCVRPANDTRCVDVYCLNRDFPDYDDSHDFNPVNHVNHVNHGSDSETHAAPLWVAHHTPPAPSQEGKGEAVNATEQGARYTYIYCLSKSLPPSLVGRGWGRGKTERRIPVGCTPASANDTRIVNPVETHCVRLANDTRRVNAVETHKLCVFTTEFATNAKTYKYGTIFRPQE
jgi:hypothetical protein